MTDGATGSSPSVPGKVDDIHGRVDAGAPHFLSLPLPALADAISGLLDNQKDAGAGLVANAPARMASAFDPAESARYLEVRDALAHHLREGASTAEAVDTVLLILDPESLRQMAAVGLRLVLNELSQLPAPSTGEGG